jgi:hypothetical protein
VEWQPLPRPALPEKWATPDQNLVNRRLTNTDKADWAKELNQRRWASAKECVLGYGFKQDGVWTINDRNIIQSFAYDRCAW